LIRRPEVNEMTEAIRLNPLHTSLESHIERERQGLSSCAAHPDGQEGLKAFSEKRKPKFNVR
jgi:enoyl-CoA hydratase/carnithine racemase